MAELPVHSRTLAPSLTRYLGFAGAGLYVLFALLALSRYPGPYAPWNNNWLSDLGNRTLNPDGANFYVLGCMAAGLLLLGFFAALGIWRASGNRATSRLLTMVQVAGGLAALALIMSAVYTEDHFGEHQFWSRLIYFGFALVFFMSPFALRRPGRRSWDLIAVAAVGYGAIVASLVFAGAHWLEWPAVAAILVYVCLVGAKSPGLASSP
jgi:hypothetical membrane protein